MASTSEWLHFHQNNNNNNNIISGGQVATPYTATSAPDLFFSGRVSEATVVSTTTTMSPTTNNPLHTGPAHVGPEGRVSKPSRRRTRASRRTPTTLLNTDTTNFRAMVQQFTGGPSNTFSPSVGGNFALGPGPSPQSFGVGPGYGLQYPMGQLQYSMSSSPNNITPNNNDTSTNMFMQSNVNVGLGGTRGGSSSSENRSSNGFQF